MKNTPLPSLKSLSEFDVGKNKRGQYEIRFTLTDKAEKDAWLFFLVNQRGDDEGLSLTIGG